MEISPIFTVLGIINTVISVIACPIIAGYKNRSVVGWIFGGLFLGLTLDKCVILNTYMQYYFIALDYLDFYVIHYWDAAYKEKDEMYQNFNFNQNTINWTASNSLFISKSVVENTDAKKRIKNPVDGFNEYNIIFTQLRDDLKRR